MQDRKATTRPLGQGITAEEHYGSQRLTQGTARDGYWGEPKPQGINAQKGVPHVGQGKVKYTPAPSVCHAKTKAGADCRARPVGGEDYCIGHMRQNAAIGD